MEIEKILVATDFSEQADVAVDQAARVARHTGARLTLLHAAHGNDGTTPQVLETQREQVAARGVHASVRVVAADPADSIIDAARDLGANLVVVGTHGRTGFSRLLLGSVAERVVRNARTSVMVARTRREGTDFERILVPTDFSEQAESALQAALVLARPGATIELFHCWMPPASVPVTGGMFPSPTPVHAKPRTSHAQDAERRGAALAERFSSERIGVSFAQTEDSAVRGIHKRLDTGLYDCVVLGSHGRRGLRRWLLGSVAEPTVRYAPCSAVVVRPL
jgi:nucleotide-binding universal stress UspA family protein